MIKYWNIENSQKIFEKLDEKTPNSMKKEISEKLVEMVDTFKVNDIIIGNFLGMGGFGFVFEGLMRGQRIALKFNSRKEEKYRTDFLKESTILSELKPWLWRPRKDYCKFRLKWEELSIPWRCFLPNIRYCNQTLSNIRYM